MKAKEILKLCETTNHEIYNAIFSYSKKRFSVMGFEWQPYAGNWWNELPLEDDSILNYNLQKKKYLHYVGELSKFLGRRRKAGDGYRFSLVSSSQPSLHLFDVEVYLSEMKPNTLDVFIIESPDISSLLDSGSARILDLISDKLNEIYETVDLVAKAIRLTSVE